MSIVVINALNVPEGQGEELEARFAARKHAVDQAPGFEGFNLLRPTGENTQYFVYTQWASQEDYENWRDSKTLQLTPRRMANLASQSRLVPSCSSLKSWSCKWRLKERSCPSSFTVIRCCITGRQK